MKKEPEHWLKNRRRSLRLNIMLTEMIIRRIVSERNYRELPAEYKQITRSENALKEVDRLLEVWEESDG